MAEHRYYWLKLQEDFFSSKRIKKLRRIAGGDTYTIIYLKMQLLSIRNGGILKYTGLESSFAEELALDLDEEVDNVSVTLQYLISCGLIETSDNIEYLLPFAALNTGSEGSSAKRVREFRERQNAIPEKLPAKSDAERQRAFRAKQKCAEKQHIPMVDADTNRKRYGGNYFLVCQRDKYQCAMCGSIENLCVHHIDGYDENKPQNNALNKMLLLCRKCHSGVHYSELSISDDILDSIGYYDEVTSNDFCNTTVTHVKRIGNGDIEIEKDIELDIPPYSPPKGDNGADNKQTTLETAEKKTKDTSRGKTIDTQFERFWKAYPKKKGKDAARKAFKRVTVPVETLLDAIEKQKTWSEWQRDNGQYIPNPSTWLNQGRWEDEEYHTGTTGRKTTEIVYKGGDFFDD